MFAARAKECVGVAIGSGLIAGSLWMLPVATEARPPEQLAAAAASGAASACLGSGAIAPAERIVSCSAAIGNGGLDGRDLAVAHLNRAQAFRAVGDIGRANADYAASLKLFEDVTDPSQLDSSHFVRRAIARHALGDATRALADYDEAIRLDTGNALAHVDRGILLANRKGDIRRSIADFSRALDLVPDNVDTLVLRADAYLTVGELGPALADAERAVQLGADNPRAFVVRGLIHAHRRDQARALDDYSEAIRIDPRHVDARVNRAAILSSLGSQERAIADLDAALAIAPRNAVALYNRGYAHFARREYDAALADYSAAIEADARMGWAYANRCLTRTIVGKDLPGALSDCDRALLLQPNNLQVRETRGFIYLKLGEPDIAFREYDTALRSQPNRPLALYGRGLARIARGDAGDGADDLAAAKALMPGVVAEFATYGLK